MLNNLSQKQKNEIIALAKQLERSPVIQCTGECRESCARRKLLKRWGQLEKAAGSAFTVNEVLEVENHASR